MGRKSRDISGIKNNSVSKLVFQSNKISRIISSVLIIIINLFAVYYTVINWHSFTANILTDMVNIGFTVVLAIVALAITVFQSDKGLLESKNSDENVRKVYLSYVFSIFPTILVLVLGYLVAYICETNPSIIGLYFIATVFILSKCVTGTMAAFVCFLNIRD